VTGLELVSDDIAVIGADTDGTASISAPDSTHSGWSGQARCGWWCGYHWCQTARGVARSAYQHVWRYPT